MAEIYGEFTEKFIAADLEEIGALVKEWAWIHTDIVSPCPTHIPLKNSQFLSFSAFDFVPREFSLILLTRLCPFGAGRMGKNPGNLSLRGVFRLSILEVRRRENPSVDIKPVKPRSFSPVNNGQSRA